MNITSRTEITSEIHHSLRTIVVHACEFLEQALLKSIYVPICFLVQSQRKIVQGNYPGAMEFFANRQSRTVELTSVAKDLATCRGDVGIGAHLRSAPCHGTEHGANKPRVDFRISTEKGGSRRGRGIS